MTEQEARAAVVREALSWLRTPYHHAGRKKGVGCDCAMFPAEVYAAAGVIPALADIKFYPEQWNQNGNAERYLDMVLHCGGREVPAPTGNGDFVLWRFGNTLAHGAIIIDWPLIVHSVKPYGVRTDDARRDAQLADRRRERHFYTLW